MRDLYGGFADPREIGLQDEDIHVLCRLTRIEEQDHGRATRNGELRAFVTRERAPASRRERYSERVNTKLLLTASAVVMGAAGIAGSFAPAEIAAALRLGATARTSLVVQLFAAVLFAFAMVNWIARHSAIGGIYNRAIAVGNVTHFVIGALALSKAVAAGERHLGIMIGAAIYIVFALSFVRVLLRSPVQPHHPT